MAAAPTIPAVIHLNEAMLDSEIIEDFYASCKIEQIGPHMGMRVVQVNFFSNLIDLTQSLLSAAPLFAYHVIVTHGTPDRGLLIRFSRSSASNATGPILGDLTKVVKKIEAGHRTEPIHWFRDPDLDEIRAKTGGTDDVATLRIAANLVQIRKRKLVISVRGCNIGKNVVLMQSYKELFNAPRFMAPESRNFFVRITPQPDAPGTKTTVEQLQKMSLTKHPRYPTDDRLAKLPAKSIRRRLFAGETDPRLKPVLIDIIDIDGHTDVASNVYIVDLHDILAWAATLNGDWITRGESTFVENETAVTPLSPCCGYRLCVAARSVPLSALPRENTAT